LLSDDDATSWNVASQVFSSSLQHHFLCTWHVDKNWKSHVFLQQLCQLDNELTVLQLREKVGNTALKQQIYSQLCVIRWERDRHAFERMLPVFVNQLPDDFRHYFTTYYVGRAEKWALCYRDPEMPDTTAHPESFHRVLKHVYMEGKIFCDL
jgi:hypothetical protein